MIDVTQLARLGLFDAKVPRYTSYPPATRFADQVNSATYNRWLAALPADTRISLYLHVPFCRRLCWFCACRTQGVRSEQPVRSYVETLKTEIATLAAALPAGVRVERLHLGGGTPTLLSPAMIDDLVDALHRALPMDGMSEFTVEIEPNEIDAPRMDALAQAGMTRASIGVQDFDPDIQATIGRMQGYDVTRQAVEMLRDRGVASLNADIVYGLPHQTRHSIADSVQMLLSLGPDRVALYGYAHVPWMAKRQSMIPIEALPTPEQRLHLFETARNLFAWDGYAEIGIDHFAKPGDGLARAAATGHLRRNFQGYTDDACNTLIGLGASAISRLPQGYAQNTPATAAYQKAVRAGGLATARGHAFVGDDPIRARVIEALMCDFRVDRAEIAGLAAQTGTDLATFDGLARQASAAFPGMLAITPSGLEIRPEGRPLTRMIARAFDAYELQTGGHSLAV